MKTVISLFLIIQTSLIAQTSDEVSYNRLANAYTYKCQYCNKEATSYYLLSIKKVSDYKLLDCVFMYENNLEVISNLAESNLRNGKCTSTLNRSEKCVVNKVSTDLNKTERITQYCGGNTLENWNKNFNEFCNRNPDFATIFEKSDFEKFKKYRLALEDKENEKFKIENEKFKIEIDKLENLILDNEFEKAAVLYTVLSKGKFGNDEFLKSQKEFIQSGLNNSTIETAILSTEDLNRIILYNNVYFKELFKENSQSIEIIFDQKGKGTINDSPTKIKNINPFVLKEVAAFKVYCKSKGTFQLTTEQIQDPNKMYLDIWVAPNIKVIKNGKKYYKKSFLSASIFRDEESVVKNDQVPSGKYWKVKHDLKLYKVNGTEIVREEQLVRESENNLNRRWGMKIARGTGSLAILTWLTIRTIEYSSVK